MGGQRRNSALNWRRRRSGGGTLVGHWQPLRETNGETAVRAGIRLELELSTDVSEWEDRPPLGKDALTSVFRNVLKEKCQASSTYPETHQQEDTLSP